MTIFLFLLDRQYADKYDNFVFCFFPFADITKSLDKRY